MIVPRRYYNTRIVATGYGYGDQFYKVHPVCSTMVYLDFHLCPGLNASIV